MKKLLIPLMILLLLPFSNAIGYENICIDNTTLEKFMNFTSCEGNTCTIYNFTQYVSCEFGCDNVTHNCRQPKIVEYSYFGIGLLGLFYW